MSGEYERFHAGLVDSSLRTYLSRCAAMRCCGVLLSQGSAKPLRHPSIAYLAESIQSSGKIPKKQKKKKKISNKEKVLSEFNMSLKKAIDYNPKD